MCTRYYYTWYVAIIVNNNNLTEISEPRFDHYNSFLFKESTPEKRLSRVYR